MHFPLSLYSKVWFGVLGMEGCNIKVVFLGFYFFNRTDILYAVLRASKADECCLRRTIADESLVRFVLSSFAPVF